MTNPLPTMRDIADHVGVSRQLVSLVLRGVPGPSAESRDRILEAAEALGYRPNTSARLLRQSRTRLIGVLFQMRNAMEVRFVERLFVRAAELGYNVVLGPETDERHTDDVVAELMSQRVEALVAFNPDPESPALRDALRHVPIVWLGEAARMDGVDTVRADQEHGLQLVVEHLVALGHRDIVYAGGGGGFVGEQRAAAYTAAMAGAGLADRAELLESGFDEEDGAAAARKFLSRPVAARPTALVCCSDHSAAGALAVLALAGVAVPGDVSVTGFDDSYVAALSYNDLTSVRQDIDATVDATLAAVVERLDDPADGPGEVRTPATLIVRGSTGPAAARGAAGASAVSA